MSSIGFSRHQMKEEEEEKEERGSGSNRLICPIGLLLYYSGYIAVSSEVIADFARSTFGKKIFVCLH